MGRMIFPNLPVQDVARTREFWTALGFAFNEEFSNEDAVAMVINEGASVMLLQEKFFHGFHDTQAHTGSEVLMGIGAENRGEVDGICKRAAELGATDVEEPVEQGPMYGGSFRDLDGHLWEVLWMDVAA